MTNAVTQARPSSCTLYEIEANLQAWATCLEEDEAQSSREGLLAEIGPAVQNAREKRDAVAAFLRHCQAQEEFADAEVKRIEQRKTVVTRVRKELEAYLVGVVDEFAAPDRRGVKRLEGNVYDDQALPAAWKDVILTMPAYVWEALLGRLTLEQGATFEERIKPREFRADKRALAPELKNGVEIPGADLSFGDLRLVID